MSDPRGACIIGIAQRTWRPDDGHDPREVPEPLAMAEGVVRAAVADARASGDVLGSVQSLNWVYCMSWPYDDPVGRLADYSNSGTLFAFAMVALAVLVLRRVDPGRARPFRTPAVMVIAPLAMAGCIYLYVSLPLIAILVLPIWGLVGLLIYFGYSRSRSHVGRGIVDVPETEIADIEPPIPGTE